MDKEILEQYIDACEVVRETEKRLERSRRKRKMMVQDTVKGSMQDFPYAAKNYKIEGVAGAVPLMDQRLRREEEILKARREDAASIKEKVEEWMNSIPPRMQRIISLRFFDEKSWGEVAAHMGRKATIDSIRKEFDRFMAEK